MNRRGMTKQRMFTLLGAVEAAMTGDEQVGRFAQRLAHLIATVHPADRGPYSYREIEAGIADQPGAMTATFINQLVKGKQKHPRMHHIEALAGFFGVPSAYFFDDETAGRVDAEIAGVIAWRDQEAAELAQRISALPPAHRNAVSTMVEHLSSYENTPRSSRRRRKQTGEDA